MSFISPESFSLRVNQLSIFPGQLLLVRFNSFPSMAFSFGRYFDATYLSIPPVPPQMDKQSLLIVNPKTGAPAEDNYPAFIETNHKASVYLVKEGEEKLVFKTTPRGDNLRKELHI